VARLKIIDWKQSDGIIAVDKDNPDSYIEEDGTIKNPKTLSVVSVDLELDGEVVGVTIEPPYSRSKVIKAVQEKYLDNDAPEKKGQDIGAEFDVMPREVR